MKNWEFTSTDNRLIIVRHAFPEDAQTLHKGFREVVGEQRWLPTLHPNGTVSDWISWIHRTRRTAEALLVAEIEYKYAGHLSLQPEEWEASRHVARLGIIVIQGLRGIGVGKSLMLAADDVARENGFEKIVLSTFADNKIARHLYESVGYRLVGIREKHFKMPHGYVDEILYEKKIL
ncbi:MAG: GNAT family N-acetyltransferase [Candidatus Thorarchaeota archaeon]